LKRHDGSGILDSLSHGVIYFVNISSSSSYSLLKPIQSVDILETVKCQNNDGGHILQELRIPFEDYLRKVKDSQEFMNINNL